MAAIRLLVVGDATKISKVGTFWKIQKIDQDFALAMVKPVLTIALVNSSSIRGKHSGKNLFLPEDAPPLQARD